MACSNVYNCIYIISIILVLISHLQLIPSSMKTFTAHDDLHGKYNLSVFSTQVFDLLVFVLTRFFFDLSCCPYLPLASEETFARVARALSKCPSASDGGDLGVFQPGELDPAFDRRLNATGAGIIVDQSILNIGIVGIYAAHKRCILSYNVVACCGYQVTWHIMELPVFRRTGVAFNPNVPIGEVVGPVPQMHKKLIVTYCH